MQNGEQIARQSGSFEQDVVRLLSSTGRLLTGAGNREGCFRRPRNAWRKRAGHLGPALLPLGNGGWRFYCGILRGSCSTNQVELAGSGHVRLSSGQRTDLNQPFGLQRPRKLRTNLRQREGPIATGGLQQKFASELPTVGSQPRRWQRLQQTMCIRQCREGASIIERNRRVKLANPRHT